MQIFYYKNRLKLIAKGNPKIKMVTRINFPNQESRTIVFGNITLELMTLMLICTI